MINYSSTPMFSFQYSNYAQHIVFGVGSIDRLGEELDGFQRQRVMLCAGGSIRRSGELARLEVALGRRLVACFEPVQPHVPEHQVEQALALALGGANDVDAVIGMGGGSPMGLAKAVSAALTKKRTGQTPGAEERESRSRVPVVAIPTTYAGSEMTPFYGITYQTNGSSEKRTVTDPWIVPQLVIYDPRLTLDLPPDLTASTGMNALAHCVEAVYSITRNPLSTAAALRGASYIARALPRCYAQGDSLEARTEMLAGSFLAGTALANVKMGLHHGICHVLGGTAGLPHGVANAIMLPHVIRFNLVATAAPLAELAGAMGIERAGRSDEELASVLAERVGGLAREFGLPARLREVRVKEEDLTDLAKIAFASRTVQNNPKRIQDAAEIESLLRAAW